MTRRTGPCTSGHDWALCDFSPEFAERNCGLFRGAAAGTSFHPAQALSKHANVTALKQPPNISTATSTPSPPITGPSPRSNTSSKSSPQSTTSTTSTRLRPLLPKPSARDASAAATSVKAAGGTMDKLPWRTSGGKKGPFTVDSGGGKRPPSQVPQGVDRPRSSASNRHSNPSTPAMSPPSSIHRHGFVAPPPPQARAFPYHPQPLTMPHSREGPMYGEPVTGSAPTTPIEYANSAAIRNAFAALSQPNPAYPTYAPLMRPPMSGTTTPLDPPPEAWSMAGLNAPDSSFDQQNNEFLASLGFGDVGANDMDPNVLNALTELIEQTSSKAVGPSNNAFDLSSALDAFAAQHPPAAPPAPQPSSLLTRRMQQPPPPGHIPVPQQNGHNPFPQGMSQSITPTGPSILHDPSLGILPTPPQSFSSTFTFSSGRGTGGPTTPWSLPDRPVFSDTPVTTPAGSDHGFSIISETATPAGPSKSASSSSSHRTPASGSLPRSHTTPLARVPPPGPVRPVAHVTQSSVDASASGSGASPWSSEINMSSLPPLPPGLSIAQLAQYGDAGLEMAIRMGMGIGMGLGQQASAHVKTASHTAPPPANPAPPARSSDVVTDILSDDFLSSRPLAFPHAVAPKAATPKDSFPPSRRPSISESTLAQPASPEEMAKRDPLATQVWKAYAKARGPLPNGVRMENLTWRMMHLTLKKAEEEEAAAAAAAAAAASAAVPGAKARANGGLETVMEDGGGSAQRGRTKGKSRVVGFDAASPEE